MEKELTGDSQRVLDFVTAADIKIRKKVKRNFAVFKKGITVSKSRQWLSSASGFDPSPDWFTGFYHMETINQYDGMYWSKFLLQFYPWNAGTDEGDTYLDINRKRERPEAAFRMTPGTAPNGVFVSPSGSIKATAELECELHVCEGDDDDCERENWPPSNGCDILKYPDCDSQCDPKKDKPCEHCKPETTKEKFSPSKLWYKNCCLAGREPRGAPSCESQENSGGAHSIRVGVALAVSIAVVLCVSP